MTILLTWLALNAAIIALAVVDVVLFIRAQNHAIKNNRWEEWLTHPNRTRPLSGFRLRKIFR